MTPKGADFLRKARSHLAKARDFFDVTDHYDDAARVAYLAGLNAAQAFIFARDGRVARTHRGVRISFTPWQRMNRRSTTFLPNSLLTPIHSRRSPIMAWTQGSLLRKATQKT
ncbi:MAG TPA: HEPN domain-containing protein [Stellaceae bacterium]|nr:HEPN domain-containing protein [Stellaceae bacterium]